jgi:predicted RecA/RadA family phage recombinase
MQAKFIQEGTYMDHTPVGAVAAGAVVVIGSIIGIAVRAIAAGVKGALAVAGVFDIVQKGAIIPDGADVYWDADGDPYGGTAGTGAATTASEGNTYIGKAWGVTTATSSTVRVILGPDKAVGRLYASVAASTAHANSTTETLLDKNFSIPAGTLKAGDILKIRACGIATATNSTDTLTAVLYLGGLAGIALATTGAVDVANNDVFFFDVTVVVRTAGASGTLVATGVQALGVPGTVTAKPFLLGSTTVDTTAALVVGVGADWSVANSGNSCRLDVLTVEKLAA